MQIVMWHSACWNKLIVLTFQNESLVLVIFWMNWFLNYRHSPSIISLQSIKGNFSAKESLDGHTRLILLDFPEISSIIHHNFCVLFSKDNDCFLERNLPRRQQWLSTLVIVVLGSIRIAGSLPISAALRMNFDWMLSKCYACNSIGDRTKLQARLASLQHPIFDQILRLL